MYLLSLVFFLQPPKPNHPVGSACSRLPWLAAPPPPYRTYPPTLASPYLYSPTRPVILRRRQPQHAPAPEPVNPRTPLCPRLDRCIFNDSCSFRLRPHPRPPPCGLGSLAVRGAPPSCIVNVVNNREEQEMTVHGEDDSRDPPASWQYTSKCLYSTSPKIWFLLMVGHLGLAPLST